YFFRSIDKSPNWSPLRFCKKAMPRDGAIAAQVLPKADESHRACCVWHALGATPMTAPAFTTSDLAHALADEHQLTKKHSLEMRNDFSGMITKQLKQGEKVKIAGLGILQVRHRAARVCRNPATGEPIQIKASKKVAFRATKELKMAI